MYAGLLQGLMAAESTNRQRTADAQNQALLARQQRIQDEQLQRGALDRARQQAIQDEERKMRLDAHLAQIRREGFPTLFREVHALKRASPNTLKWFGSMGTIKLKDAVENPDGSMTLIEDDGTPTGTPRQVDATAAAIFGGWAPKTPQKRPDPLAQTAGFVTAIRSGLPLPEATKYLDPELRDRIGAVTLGRDGSVTAHGTEDEPGDIFTIPAEKASALEQSALHRSGSGTKRKGTTNADRLKALKALSDPLAELDPKVKAALEQIAYAPEDDAEPGSGDEGATDQAAANQGAAAASGTPQHVLDFYESLLPGGSK